MVTPGTSPKINLSAIQFEILTAAGKIITHSGIAGLTIENLAKEMQTTETSIYQHYLIKDDIIISMLNYLAYDIDMCYTRAMEGKTDTEEMFVKLLRNQAAFFIENPYFVIVAFSDGLLEEYGRINNSISKIMDIKISHLMPIIVSGQENGYFRNDLSPEELVHIVMGAFRLLMYKWRLANFSFNLKPRNENMLQTVLTLIRA